jgi:hypothetical protein
MRVRSLLFSALASSALVFAVACGDDTDPPILDTIVQDDMGIDAFVQLDTFVQDDAVVGDMAIDMVADDMAADTAADTAADIAADTSADITVAPDQATVDAASADATVVTGNGTCAKAATITLVAGMGLVAGDTSANTDEFSAGVKCSRFPTGTSTTTMDGPQSYFKFTGKAGQLYRITTTAAFTSYTYVFTSSACTAAAINTDCQSNGATGVFSSSVSANKPEPIYFKPTTAGDVYVAVDSTYTTTAGAFVLSVQEMATPTNTKCTTAQAVTLSGGKATIKGDIDGVIAPDEFGATVACPSSSSSYQMDGPNLYYKLPVFVGKAYTLKLTSLSIDYIRLFYFTTTTCSASAISTDCQSSGATGGGLSSSAYPGTDQELLYVPTTSGTLTFALDYTSLSYHGQFQVEIEEVTAPTNTKCTTAKTVTLTGGKAVVKGDTKYSSDEFSGLNCKVVGSTYTTSSLSGRQLYYKWATVKDQWYKLTLSPTDYYMYLYVFTSSACTEAAIETDCQSGGATGNAIGSVYDGESESLYFKAPSTGTAYFGVDYTSAGYTSAFEATLEEFTLPTNSKCANAETITLTAGKGSVLGDTGPVITPDEFSTLACGTSSSVLDGPQAYYQVGLTANQNYLFTLTSTSATAIYAYLFSNTCTLATIQSDCQSAGISGGFTSFSTDPKEAISVGFKPTSSATYKVGVDSYAPTAYGGFTLAVEAFTPLTNDSCGTAKVVTLTAGKATAQGLKGGVTNTLAKCGSTSVDAEDVFYKFTPTVGKKYKITFKPQGQGGRFGVWDGNHGCVASAVETACGTLGSVYVNGGQTDSLTITSTSGDIYFVADGLSSLYDAYKFSFEIEELP